jgi:phosphoribosylpyrophosphate synthetase
MNYKETLFFVAKCLTISKDKKNKIFIENLLKKEVIDWDNVVKVSTAHFVFPALYINLREVNFLNYLPNDLVAYMQHITNLNRERNQQIIDQTKELNTLLLSNNITPIFLKGVSYLLEGLYIDIAERMVGDIDFIVSKKDYKKTAKVLHEFGYETVLKTDNHFPQFKHYPRIHKKNCIAAVEIHKELLEEKYSDEFNYNTVSKKIFSLNNFTVLGFEDQLNLSIISKQINDDGQLYKTISLKNTYDIFLLSKKVNSLSAITLFKKLYNPLNAYLALCNYILDVNSIEFNETKFTDNYIKNFNLTLDGNKEKLHLKNKKLHSLKVRLEVLKKAITDKAYRKWLFKRIIYGRAKKT